MLIADDADQDISRVTEPARQAFYFASGVTVLFLWFGITVGVPFIAGASFRQAIDMIAK